MNLINNAMQAAKFAEAVEGEWTRLRFGEQIYRLRKRRAMDQYELAYRSGISQSAISRIENTRIEPTWHTYRQLLAALDCRPLLLPKPLNEWPRMHSQWRGGPPHAPSWLPRPPQ